MLHPGVRARTAKAMLKKQHFTLRLSDYVSVLRVRTVMDVAYTAGYERVQSRTGSCSRRHQTGTGEVVHTKNPATAAIAAVAGKIRTTRQVGLEPTTYGLEGRCSIQLSYWRRSQPVPNIAGRAPERFARSRGDRIRTCDPLVPNQVRYRAAPLPVRLAAKLCIAAAMVNPASPAQERARSDSAAVRTARPRWLISFFRSGASSPKVHPSEGMKKSGS